MASDSEARPTPTFLQLMEMNDEPNSRIVMFAFLNFPRACFCKMIERTKRGQVGHLKKLYNICHCFPALSSVRYDVLYVVGKLFSFYKERNLLI